MPDTNDTAPDFVLPRDGGGKIALSDLRGGAVVLFFYPKDDTPGCTRESIGFSEHSHAFAEAGARVFGISRDSVARHDRFVARHGLSVPLLSDEDGAVCEDYGVWTEKKNYGRTYMGIERTTFLIGPDGRIARVWRKVRVAGHAETVLAAVRAMDACA
ncbi:MAG: peroxiredoxin [Jhaorihella sp.]